MNFENVSYAPQFKWKAGERAAVTHFDPAWSDRVLPLFRMTPFGSFDAELKVTLTADQLLKKFGTQLADVTGRSPALIDAELLENPEEFKSAIHPVHPLLERARIAGAHPIPVYRPSSSEIYLKACKRFLTWSESKCGCLRVSLDDIEAIKTREELKGFMSLVGANAKESVLIIDAGPLSISDEEELAALIAYQVTRLVRPMDWACVIFSVTSFPESPKIPPWSSEAFERSDWMLYREMYRIRDEFSVFPVFSDYGLEYPANYKPIQVQPVAHLRYSTENKYFIFKGKSVKFDEKYANIFPVAASLVASGIYKGADYSDGDAYIAQLATASGKTGHASKWRWCSTDHHLRLVMRQLNELLSLGLGQSSPQVEPDQLQLILP